MKLVAALTLALLPTLAGFAAPARDGDTGLTPGRLMCELMARPWMAPISDPKPELSWVVSPGGFPVNQSAYQIRVFRGEDGKGAAEWDSGKVKSPQNVAVEYGGAALRPETTYSWQVRIWDDAGKASRWSEVQRFRTGTFSTDRSGDGRITVSRYPLVRSEIGPKEFVAVEAPPNGCYFYDFGRAAYAGLKLRLTPTAPDQKVVVHLGEMLEAPRRVARKPGGSIRYQRVELPLTMGVTEYTVPLDARDARRMPPEIGAVMPYRYVEVEHCPSPMSRGTATQLAVNYPFAGSTSFECSDPRLQAVWDLCQYSVKATSFCGLYVDGDRERLPYEADAYINQLGQYGTDLELTLARYSHEYLLLHPTWPTEWHLHSVLMAWADYLYTGDRESLAEFYPDLREKTLRSLARVDGLISTVQPPVPKEVLTSLRYPKGIRDIVDWPMAERDGYEMRPVNTVVNAFHCHALALLAKMADALGKKEDARDYREAAARATAAFNEKLFDPATGLYVDGEGSKHSSLHANMFPLAFGLVPAERRAKVAEFLKSKGMACSVYGAQFLMEALYEAGEGEHALKLMTAPGDRSWAHMLDVGTTITLEAWDNKYKPNQDWSHAWGAAPANLIPRCLMGIQPLEPGFRRFRVRPQLGGLESAKIGLWTVSGRITVDCRSRPGDFAATVQVPANTSAEVWIPRGDRVSGSVGVDGVARRARTEGPFLVLDRLGPGTHLIHHGAVRSGAASGK